MKKLLLIVLLLPYVTSAAGCDPVKCSAQSRISSEPFCSNDDAYAMFTEYYCAGNDCVARNTPKLIEDCRFGCSLGSCITCDISKCEAKGGYYSGSYCRDNNVYKTYREYYCDNLEGCVFRESKRVVEECEQGVECTQGKCGLCDTEQCNQKDNFYDDEFCKADGNVYKQYRDYRCIRGSCLFAALDVKIADCPYACSDGKCMLPKCEPSCSSKDAFVGETYCKGNSVFRNFRDYYCGSIKCEFNETEKKIEDCKDCKDGKCVIVKSANERLFEFDVQFSNETKEKNITILPGRIFNGFLFGKSDASIELNASVKDIDFTVLNSNKIGELMILADNGQIYNTTKLGHHAITLNRKVNKFTITASSSGLIFWMPNVYDLGLITVTTELEKTKRNEAHFTLSKELGTFRYAEIIEWPSSTRIRLNGQVLESNVIRRDYLKTENTIEFLPLINETFSKKAVLKIVYEG